MSGFTTHFWLSTPNRNLRALVSYDGLRLRAVAWPENGGLSWSCRIWDPRKPGTMPWRLESLQSKASALSIANREVEGEGGVVQQEPVPARWAVDPTGTAGVLVAEVGVGEVWLLAILYRVANSTNPADARWSADPDALAGDSWEDATSAAEWERFYSPDGEPRGKRISDSEEADEPADPAEVDLALLDRAREELDWF